MQRIVIVGGIGGLCAARAVALASHEPVVLERSPVGNAIGAGLMLGSGTVAASCGSIPTGMPLAVCPSSADHDRNSSSIS